MPEQERVTPAGVIVVEDVTEEPPQKVKKERRLRVRGIRKHPVLGTESKTEVRMEITHTLTPEDRKARREDNKTMSKSREIHRRRKKHGRHR
jgi:hypothetical protein